MPERIAKVAQDYAQRPVKVGQRFHVEQHDVDLLLQLGRIEPVDGEPGYETSDLSAGVPAPYMTRDIQARRGHKARR
jgi:hypothetical protein